MAWLAGFNNRTQITIDSSKIGSSLTDFPVFIAINSTSGTGNQDLTDLFDDLGSDSNRKKIAVTTDDGTTQCYVEIESYDFTAETMCIHTKVPSILSSVDTVLYLYWDATASDNTTYVGDTGDAVAQNVWDSNFKRVYHLADAQYNGTANEVIDSTSNGYHGVTTGGAATPTKSSSGPKGASYYFDGADYISTPARDYSNSGGVSVEGLISTIQVGYDADIFSDGGAASAYRGVRLYLKKAAGFQAAFEGSRGTTGTYNFRDYGGSALNDGTWRHISGQWKGDGTPGNPRVCVNGVKQTAGQTALTGGQTQYPSGHPNGIGAFYYGSTFYPRLTGYTSEIRVSNIERSDDWMAATKATLFDELISYSAPATPPVSGDPDTFVPGPDDSPHRTGDKFVNVVSGDAWFNVLSCSEVETSWDIQNDFDKDTSWDTQNSFDKNTSWDILNAYTRAISWDILNTWVKDTSWDTLNSFDKGIAWDILATYTRDIAWDIQNSYDQQMSWNIFPQYITNIAIFVLNYIKSDFKLETYADPVMNYEIQEIQTSFSMKEEIKTSFEVAGKFDNIKIP